MELNRHIGVKILLHAERMNKSKYNYFREWNHSEQEGDREGFLVVYEGKPNTEKYPGYVSWSPKEEFEGAYFPVSQDCNIAQSQLKQTLHSIVIAACHYEANLDCGIAFLMMEDGHRMMRVAWTDKGIYVYYVPGGTYPTQTESAKKEFGDFATYRPYFAMKNADGTVSTWAPSAEDCIVRDWKISPVPDLDPTK